MIVIAILRGLFSPSRYERGLARAACVAVPLTVLAEALAKWTGYP